MANSKKKTVKADKEKSTVKEPVVNEAEVLETEAEVKEEKEAGVVQEEAKEEISANTEPEAGIEVSGEEQVKEDNAGAEEPVRKKRKYTKRAAKESKTENAASKKNKKDVKEAESIQEVYLEFGNKKVLSEDILEQIRQAYKNEGHRISSIKKLQVYMNIDDGKAYYVINDKAEGKYVKF